MGFEAFGEAARLGGHLLKHRCLDGCIDGLEGLLWSSLHQLCASHKLLRNWSEHLDILTTNPLKTGLETPPKILHGLLHSIRRKYSLSHQLLAVLGQNCWVLLDELIHLRLGETWLISLIVTVPSVANEVNDDVSLDEIADVAVGEEE